MNDNTIHRRFLITGASGGLGKAFCAACASRRFGLFLTDRQPQALEILASGLEHEYGVEVETLACDLSSEADRDRFFMKLEELSLEFDGLINVAGYDVEGEFASKSVEYLRSMIQVNILGMIENINRTLRFRRKSGRFIIINVASLAAFQPMPYKAMYSASKRFLLHLSLGIREELKESGVSVTALCPSGMPTSREAIEAIKVQGLAGTLTTMNTGEVAEYALKCAFRGKAVVVPGALNKAIMHLSSVCPEKFTARLVRWQWTRALMKRCGTLKPQEANA